MGHAHAEQFDSSEEWTRKYEWFRNENWTWPMFPKRFVESGCLKCHHDVVDLEPSTKYPDPPAPKLIAGYETIRRYGCFGCHEINGFAGAGQADRSRFAIGAELLRRRRAIENRSRPGEARQAGGPKWADDVVAAQTTPTRVIGCYELVMADADKGQGRAIRSASPEAGAASRFASPGSRAQGCRYARHAAQSRPQLAARRQQVVVRFSGELDRQSEKLPPRHANAAVLRPVGSFGRRGLAESQRFEPIEIRALAEYLLKASQPFEYVEPPKGVEPDAELTKPAKLRRSPAARKCSKRAAASPATSTSISRRPRKRRGPIFRASARSWPRIRTAANGYIAGCASRTVITCARSCPIVPRAGQRCRRQDDRSGRRCRPNI